MEHPWRLHITVEIEGSENWTEEQARTRLAQLLRDDPKGHAHMADADQDS